MKKQIVLPLLAMLIASPLCARASSGHMTVSTTALSFNGSSGNVSSQPFTISVSGSAVVVRSVTISNSAFSIPAVSMPVTLPGGQSFTIPVSAQPASSAQSGKLTIFSSAGIFVISLSETAMTTSPTSHQVNLSWQAPSSSGDAIDSYQVDRAASGSTAFSVVGTTSASSTSFTDTSVTAGASYVYEIRSVDGSGNVSSPSNTVTLTIP